MQRGEARQAAADMLRMAGVRQRERGIAMREDEAELLGAHRRIERHDTDSERIQRQKMQEELDAIVECDRDALAGPIARRSQPCRYRRDARSGLGIPQSERVRRIPCARLQWHVQEIALRMGRSGGFERRRHRIGAHHSLNPGMPLANRLRARRCA